MRDMAAANECARRRSIAHAIVMRADCCFTARRGAARKGVLSLRDLRRYTMSSMPPPDARVRGGTPRR